MENKIFKNHEFRRVICPTCKAIPFFVCVGHNGNMGDRVHKARKLLADSVKVSFPKW